MNTMSLASGLQSARGSTVNLENTQELKAFATIDLTKINKDRSNQLKLALEDNVKDKEKELESVKESYETMKKEYDTINENFTQKSQDLESMIKE